MMIMFAFARIFRPITIKWHKKVIYLFGAALLLVFVFYLRISQFTTPNFEPKKLILIYGKPVPHEPWGPRNPEEASKYAFTDWDGSPCEERRCQLTFGREYLPVSDAVLVHNNWGPAKRLPFEAISKIRPLTQRWVLYTKEPPGVLSVSPHLNGFFNWTATYRRDSDFFVPYGSYVSLDGQSDPQSFEPENLNYASGKDKLAIFGISNHCGGQRMDIIRGLMKYIDISFFGKCATQFDTKNIISCPHNLGKGCAEEIKRYKFYLSFENSLCKDYITEKYWRNALERGLVPVVFGASNYTSDEVIPGSFIKVADFDSIRSLANYLVYLDKNDVAYNQYFKWKTKYKPVKYNFWLCQLCKALHDPTKPPKIYHNISHFWGVKGACKINKDFYYGLIENA